MWYDVSRARSHHTFSLSKIRTKIVQSNGSSQRSIRQNGEQIHTAIFLFARQRRRDKAAAKHSQSHALCSLPHRAHKMRIFLATANGALAGPADGRQRRPVCVFPWQKEQHRQHSDIAEISIPIRAHNEHIFLPITVVVVVVAVSANSSNITKGTFTSYSNTSRISPIPLPKDSYYHHHHRQLTEISDVQMVHQRRETIFTHKEMY